MTEKTPAPSKNASPDWFVRGALTRIGDTFDRFLGRKWVPSSSLATSELIERIKKLLDNEAKEVSGKGLVVPHDIKIKVQWNKFSTDGSEVVEKLENELLVATVDHINDSLYYTYAPLAISIDPDYFSEGVRITAGFGPYSNEAEGAELNVTIANVDVSALAAEDEPAPSQAAHRVKASFDIGGKALKKTLDLTRGQSLSIGRSGSNGLVVDDNSVSKIHASLSIDAEGDLSIADTGSTNGTFLNGERIAYAKAIKLSSGDKVTFGTVDVLFEQLESEPADEPMEGESDAETVAIDGFEFTSRQSVDVSPDAVEDKEVE